MSNFDTSDGFVFMKSGETASTAETPGDAEKRILEPEANFSGWPLLVDAMERGTSVNEDESVVGSSGSIGFPLQTTEDWIIG